MLLMDLFVLCVVCLTVCELFVFIVEVLCWIYCVWSSKECVCCACCDSSVHLSVPSIDFVYVFVYQKLSTHLRAVSQLFALLMLFPCVILHTIWSGKSLQLLCILPFGMLCLSAISMMFV